MEDTVIIRLDDDAMEAALLKMWAALVAASQSRNLSPRKKRWPEMIPWARRKELGADPKWSLSDLLFLMAEGDYTLLPAVREGRNLRLGFLPHGYPHGSPYPIRALAEAFGATIVEVY